MGMSAISVLHDSLLIVCCYISLLGVFAWIVAGVPTAAYCAPVADGPLGRPAFTKAISEGADESMCIALRRSVLVLAWHRLRHRWRRQQRGDPDCRHDHFQVRSHVRNLGYKWLGRIAANLSELPHSALTANSGTSLKYHHRHAWPFCIEPGQ